jgi:hypothetical protein
VPDPTVPPSNGVDSTEPKRSLRETLENAWDKVTEEVVVPDQPSDPQAAPIDSSGQPRDERGRWARRDEPPGEAEQRPQQAAHPAPTDIPQGSEEPHPAPAQPGGAAQAPANWSAEDRAAFDELTDKGKQFVLRRHSEMESFAQQRVQASAQAANFAQSLAPIFNDQRIARSLQEAGVGAAEAIHQWAGFHLRFLTDPVNMISELIQRAGVDPAVFASRPQPGGPGPTAGIPPEALKDPALKVIADHLGRSQAEQAQLRNELQAMRTAGEQRQAAEVMRVTRWGIDSFASEKDEKGNLSHPHFDAVLPHIIELFKANPQRDLREAYEQALWMDANVRGTLLQRERATVAQQQADQRAAQAVRSNTRGRTSPVTPPAPPTGQKRSLRETLEAAADSVGLE